MVVCSFRLVRVSVRLFARVGLESGGSGRFRGGGRLEEYLLLELVGRALDLQALPLVRVADPLVQGRGDLRTGDHSLDVVVVVIVEAPREPHGGTQDQDPDVRRPSKEVRSLRSDAADGVEIEKGAVRGQACHRIDVRGRPRRAAQLAVVIAVIAAAAALRVEGLVHIEVAIEAFATSRRSRIGLSQRLAKGDSLLQGCHGEGVGAEDVREVDRRRDRPVPVAVGLDDDDHGAPLPVGGRFDLGVVARQSRQPDLVDGAVEGRVHHHRRRRRVAAARRRTAVMRSVDASRWRRPHDDAADGRWTIPGGIAVAAVAGHVPAGGCCLRRHCCWRTRSVRS
mmetsp:Transcript_19357/g.45016  ORF Transcript_19357/g.45016 Transcript_19357/m.45016 type:complete len:338 (-) Transcript_19357:277-1290(-)